MWYEGISHQNASAGTKVKVICKGQGQVQWLHFSKNGRFGSIRVSQTHHVSTRFSKDFFFKFVNIVTIWQNLKPVLIE